MHAVPLSEPWTVLVTGAGGLIGHQLLRTAGTSVPGWKIHAPFREQLNLTDASAVRHAFRDLRPNAVIHCAALTSMAACQQDPPRARTLNIEATARLANFARDVPFIFLSTDLVFDGRREWYDESADPNPLSVYAETKLEAERIVLANLRHTVIRTSLNGGTSPKGDRSFNEEMRQAWQAGKTLTLFIDEFRCPIPAVVTAQALWELVRQGEPGLYHVAGAERLSRWEIGRLLADRCRDINPKMKAASRLDYPGPPRPADTSLLCTKAQRRLSFPLPRFSEWLRTSGQL